VYSVTRFLPLVIVADVLLTPTRRLVAERRLKLVDHDQPCSIAARTARTSAMRDYPNGGTSEPNDDREDRQQNQRDKTGAQTGEQVGAIA
jgi:hypothetical protein